MNRHRLPLLPAILGLGCLLLCACAGTRTRPVEAGPKKLYVDANLGCSVTIAAQWPRRFVAVPPGGAGTYAVRWMIKTSDGGHTGSLLELTRLARPYPQNAEAALQLVKRQWPAFVVTGVDDRTPGRIDLVGHTAHLTLAVHLAALGEHWFELVLAAPPEQFDPLRRSFDRVAESLAALPK